MTKFIKGLVSSISLGITIGLVMATFLVIYFKRNICSRLALHLLQSLRRR